MSEHLVRQLHHIRRDLAEKTLELQELLLRNPDCELEDIMSLVDNINALGARIDAVAALLPADIATAVAAQKATDDAANAATIQELADATTAVAGLAAKVTALETAAGVPAKPAALAVNPTSITSTAGSALTQTLSVSGGAAPYSFASNLADVAVDASGVMSGTPAAAETGEITVSDSATPPASASVSVTIT